MKSKTFTVHLADDYPTENMTDLEFARECLRDLLAGREPLSVVDEHGVIGVYYIQELL